MVWDTAAAAAATGSTLNAAFSAAAAALAQSQPAAASAGLSAACVQSMRMRYCDRLNARGFGTLRLQAAARLFPAARVR